MTRTDVISNGESYSVSDTEHPTAIDAALALADFLELEGLPSDFHRLAARAEGPTEFFHHASVDLSCACEDEDWTCDMGDGRSAGMWWTFEWAWGSKWGT